MIYNDIKKLYRKLPVHKQPVHKHFLAHVPTPGP